MYRAGKLNRRITIQHLTAGAPDSVGDATSTWAELATVWAEVIVQAGSETFQTQQRTAKQERVFRIRFRDGLDPTMRIVYRGEAHEILDITESAAGDPGELLDVRAFVREAKSGGA